jgi:hypothetical protein
LDTLLQICSLLGISPLQLFIGNGEENCPLQNLQFSNPSFKRPRCFRQFDSKRVQGILEAALNEEVSPSMLEMSRRLEYLPGYLWRYFPDLSRQSQPGTYITRQKRVLSALRYGVSRYDRRLIVCTLRDATPAKSALKHFWGNRDYVERRSSTLAGKKRCKSWVCRVEAFNTGQSKCGSIVCPLRTNYGVKSQIATLLNSLPPLHS